VEAADCQVPPTPCSWACTFYKAGVAQKLFRVARKQPRTRRSRREKETRERGVGSLSPWGAHSILRTPRCSSERHDKFSKLAAASTHIPGMGRNSNTSIDPPGAMKCGWFFKRSIRPSFDSAWRME